MSFASGQDSLTCKFLFYTAFLSVTNFIFFIFIFLDLCSLLNQMNDFCNLGNANAVLAVLNFNHHDCLADEFIHQLFCLVGEDAPEALVDNYFNEAQVMETLDEILDNLPLFDNDIP